MTNPMDKTDTLQDEQLRSLKYKLRQIKIDPRGTMAKTLGDWFEDEPEVFDKIVALFATPTPQVPVGDETLTDILLDHVVKSRGLNIGQYITEYECSCGARLITDGHDHERANLSIVIARHVAGFLNSVITQATELAKVEGGIKALDDVIGIYNRKFEPNGEFREFGSLSKDDVASLYLGIGEYIRDQEQRLRTLINKNEEES